MKKEDKKCEYWISGHKQCDERAIYIKNDRRFCKAHAILLCPEYLAGKKGILDEPSLDKFV